MSKEEPERENGELRSDLVRLAWAAAFFTAILAVFVVLFAVGLFH